MAHDVMNSSAAYESQASEEAAARLDDIVANPKESGADPQYVEIAIAIEWHTKAITKSWLQQADKTSSTMSISVGAKVQPLMQDVALNDE